ncbi:hypothetical protein BFO_0950 [Tannerella forsythia 92A2]|uniref:Uncharacterized protein n=1 Tax=Tannerella forsythia (strain ATCC 43037 / JCM 10827 / CCUG 21028 A / KCTC 5666 / FDC 338) TaxID=203275 RepID=G8UPY3_TANFA|nr:hypothetical protein BFO_0950 [Tannerella forsythia 92A2]
MGQVNTPIFIPSKPRIRAKLQARLSHALPKHINQKIKNVLPEKESIKKAMD